MYDFSPQANLIIQGCVAAIVIGVFYNLWVTTKAYGGLIGKAVRYMGIGMLFITIEVIERIMVNFSILQNSANMSMVQDIMSLLALVFLGIGFSKLASITKS